MERVCCCARGVSQRQRDCLLCALRVKEGATLMQQQGGRWGSGAKSGVGAWQHDLTAGGLSAGVASEACKARVCDAWAALTARHSIQRNQRLTSLPLQLEVQSSDICARLGWHLTVCLRPGPGLGLLYVLLLQHSKWCCWALPHQVASGDIHEHGCCVSQQPGYKPL